MTWRRPRCRARHRRPCSPGQASPETEARIGASPASADLPGCGSVLAIEPDRARPRSTYCATCLAERRSEIDAAIHDRSPVTAEHFTRRTGVRPTHTPEATAKRREANSVRRAEQAAREAEHVGEVYGPTIFAELVAPGLAAITLPAIAKATGMSTSAAAKHTEISV